MWPCGHIKTARMGQTGKSGSKGVVQQGDEDEGRGEGHDADCGAREDEWLASILDRQGAQ